MKASYDELKKESKLVKAQLDESVRQGRQAQEALAQKTATAKQSPPKRPKMVDHGVSACIVADDIEKAQLRKDIADGRSEFQELLEKFRTLEFQLEKEQKSNGEKTSELVNNVRSDPCYHIYLFRYLMLL